VLRSYRVVNGSRNLFLKLRHVYEHDSRSLERLAAKVKRLLDEDCQPFTAFPH